MRSVASFLILSGIVIALWWWPNRLHNPQGGRADKFISLSYDGYRPGESPLTDRFPTAAEVDQDLALLAPVTRAIRTYAAVDGPYEIPAIAQKHGLHVWQGIWLGGDRSKNTLEMARAIDMAHRFPGTIERLVVGNEVLLRRDLPPAELIADIDHVRAAVHQPVAYADVSDFWDQFPEVAPHVDVVMIHLLPYWEDVPTGIDRAVAVVGAAYDHFASLFPGKRVSIGETGWPSRGRQRHDAVPSRVNQARFLREFMALAASKQFDYNFIEAFDQHWKYENEGVIGANWGLFTADRHVKIAPTGPLREDPSWALHAGFSVVCGAILAAIGLAGGKAQQPQAVLLAMTLGAALGVAQAGAAPVLYDGHVHLAAVANLGGQALLAALTMLRFSGAVRPAPWRTGGQATARVINLFRLRRPRLAGAVRGSAVPVSLGRGYRPDAAGIRPALPRFPADQLRRAAGRRGSAIRPARPAHQYRPTRGGTAGRGTRHRRRRQRRAGGSAKRPVARLERLRARANRAALDQSGACLTAPHGTGIALPDDRLRKPQHWFVLGFAASGVAGSLYGLLQGAWPFGVVEAIWSVVA